MPDDLVGWLSLGGLLLVLALGALFLASPRLGFAMTKHQPDGLPHVMVPRYLFMALMIALSLVLQDVFVTATVFAGLAIIGFYDAVVYWLLKGNPWPHLAAGVAAGAVAGLAFAKGMSA
jgi:hypothetical protein